MSSYKVLVPLDGSRLAERSLNYLPAFKKLGALEVELLGVIDEPNELLGPLAEEAIEREANIVTTYIATVAEELGQHLGIEVESKVLGGEPDEVIVTYADRIKPNLLIISTHGRSGLQRWRLGSVADNVVHQATWPTLVIGPKAGTAHWPEAEMIEPFQSILVPLDGSPLAEQALAPAQEYAQHFGSQVHLVRVVTLPVMADGMGMTATYVPEVLSAIEEGGRDYLSKVAAQLALSGKTETEVLVGSPAIELEEYAKKNNIDLIVMTSHGRGGIVRTTLGSVADRMLGTVAPVLIVRPTEVKTP